MMQMSSTTSARCGSISESSAPHCPCRANLNRGPSTAASGPDERIALPADDRRRQRLALELRQLGLVVEQVELARRTGHEEMDDPLRLRREVRRPGRQRVRRPARPQRGERAAGAIASPSSAASAILPTPTPHSSKKWRRVTAQRVQSASGFIGLSFRDGLVEVQERPRQDRPGGALDGVAMRPDRRSWRRPAPCARAAPSALW